MTKRNDELSAVAHEAILEGVPGFAYVPTDKDRALKAQFWSKFKQNPIVDEADVTPELVKRYTGRDISGLMKHPDFWVWFSNSRTTEQLLEMAAERGAAMAVRMLDPSVVMNDNARVQLIKIVMDYSGRTPPSHKVIKWADRDVAALDEDQLDELIAKLSKKRKTQLPEP